MAKYIDIKISAVCPALNDIYDDVVSIDYDRLEYLIPYLYEQHFGVKYKELGWWLEDGAEKFVKDIEDKWWHNTLEIDSLQHNEKFANYLIDNYEKLDLNLEDLLEDFKSDLEMELEFLDKEELQELDDDYGGVIDFEIYLNDKSISSIEIELPDYDDLYDEDDDDL